MDNETIRKQVRGAFQRETTLADTSPSQRAAILARLDDGGRVRARLMLIPALALLTTLLCGAAVAAGLGLFGRFAQSPMSENSAARLERLDEIALSLDAQATVEIAGAETPSVGSTADADVAIDTNEMTVVQTALTRLSAREFALTLDQTYCDGCALYYSYTLETQPLQTIYGEGNPTGISEWDQIYPDKRFEEVLSLDDDAQTARVADWLNGHDAAYVVCETVGLGDGAMLGDAPLDIFGSDSAWMDEGVLQGYQEVSLSEDFTIGDSLDVSLSVLYGAMVYYQDTTGLYVTRLAPENRGIIHLNATIPVNADSTPVSGTLASGVYDAEARLTVSDAGAVGALLFRSAYGMSALNYDLVSDGEVLRNRDGGYKWLDDGTFFLSLRFDPPKDAHDLTLRPAGADGPTENDIPLN